MQLLHCYIVTLLQKSKKQFAIFLIISLFLPTLTSAASADILKITDNVASKKDQLKELQDSLELYKQKITEARKKGVTLKNEIELLNNNIKKTELEIQEAELNISQMESDITSLNGDIADAKQKISLQKDLVSYYLREMQRMGGKTPLEIILLHPSFSKFFDEMNNLEILQNNLGDSIAKLKETQDNLEKTQNTLKDKKEATVKLKNDLEIKKAKLGAQKTAKTFLIGETFASESKFQALLLDAQKESAQLDADISRLENEARNKLKQSDLFPYEGNIVFTWPVPKNDITAYFHDPDYPFRYVSEHAGIDVRAAQGTPIAAPAPGYVLKVRDSQTWRDYSYVVIAHAGGISTVYLHLSRVYVKPDTYVSRGQIIGLSGGTPRTRGAGLFTTGPHLHFEVRANGIPVDPLNYLVDL
jgi:murein DD-endopeptidase MepM/ murein hydrolase activator NlpD